MAYIHRFVGDATIRGAALKDGLKLACFALSSENDHTKGGHHMSEAINKLFINNAHIAGSLTERMGLPLAAELASSMIMVSMHLFSAKDTCALSEGKDILKYAIPKLMIHINGASGHCCANACQR